MENIIASQNSEVIRKFLGESSQTIQVESPFVDAAPDNADSLPAVVWLRGDEPYFSDFSIDADQAMILLGIKRSRLTQLSGKELRVGRVKVDRFIRPVYRKIDIDEYLQATRASISHAKSSHIVNEAAEKLNANAEKMTLQVIEQTTTQLHDLKDFFAESLSLQFQSLENSYKFFTQDLYDQLQQLNQNTIQTLATKDQSIKEDYVNIDAKLSALGQLQEMFLQKIEFLKIQNDQNFVRIENLFREQAKFIEQVIKLLLSLKQDTKHLEHLPVRNLHAIKALKYNAHCK